jgi:DNA-binding response OmpR family regulator
MTKILVIEDEEMLRENILAWLTYEGYEAIGAADGVEGVNTAIRLEPDLIVCDIGLPYLDGYGVLLDVRANSTTQLIPFIFLTAKSSPDAIRKGMHLGADDYLTKPFARTDLLDAIQVRLRRRAIRESENKRQIEAFKDALSLERSQRLLQYKLVAMFSHDFRTPLSTIMTSTRLLRDYASRMDEARREAQLDRIEVSTHKLIQMLDDMLLVAQIESGKFEFTPEPTDLAEFIQQIVEEYQAVYSMTHQIMLETISWGLRWSISAWCGRSPPTSSRMRSSTPPGQGSPNQPGQHRGLLRVRRPGSGDWHSRSGSGYLVRGVRARFQRRQTSPARGLAWRRSSKPWSGTKAP